MPNNTLRSHIVKGIAIFAVAFAFLGAAFATTQQASADVWNQGKLGVWVYSNSRFAITDATVSVYDQYGNLRAEGMTNAQGYFTAYLNPETYKIYVTAPGFLPGGTTALVKAGETATVTVMLQSYLATPIGNPQPATSTVTSSGANW